MNLIESGLLAVAGTSLAIAALRPLSAKLHLVDIPNQRKQHVGAIPLIGGIAVCIGVLLSMLLTLPKEPALLTLMSCGVFIVILGAIDDAKDISPWLRLGVQALLVLIVCKSTGITLHRLGDIIGMGDISVRWFDLILTVIAICGAINAYNMMDGIDGLAGSMAMISFMGLAGLLHDNMPLLADFSQLFILALLPYLCVNLSLLSSKRKIFLGDAGSMLLGFVIGFMVIFGSQQTQADNAFRPVTALWIIGLPLMDMVGIMMRRILKGQSPLRADRNHLHHILMHAGFTPRESLFIMVALGITMMLIGLFGEYFHVPEVVMMGAFLLLFIVYSIGLQYAWRIGRWVKKSIIE
ncbi:UDP-N-acetylglucosamine--undecaprenyl-phosphate N-acetylglucosaminephosphotransferase [Pseudaeromonas paramecii]|uniref:Undecaprenyl-phosphate alpha-N-acetylglucosaminyl 1-phosphate transferase n=1 Tax=Pseudaeromonas paramecii TaxID=2138166 RepID=A0ABP8Q190_9GAMM